MVATPVDTPVGCIVRSSLGAGIGKTPTSQPLAVLEATKHPSSPGPTHLSLYPIRPGLGTPRSTVTIHLCWLV